MKLRAALIGLVAVGALAGATTEATARMPFAWKFTVNGVCHAEERSWLRAVEPLVLLGHDLFGAGAQITSPDAWPEIRECWNRRGYWGDPRSVRIIQARFPTAAERQKSGGG